MGLFGGLRRRWRRQHRHHQQHLRHPNLQRHRQRPGLHRGQRVRFSTTGATTTDGDDPSQAYTQSFKLGATVVVKAAWTAATAKPPPLKSLAASAAWSPTSASATSTAVVAGQLVKFDTNTVIDGEGDATFTLAWLAANWSSSSIAIEVYGTADASGAPSWPPALKEGPAALVYAVKAM